MGSPEIASRRLMLGLAFTVLALGCAWIALAADRSEAAFPGQPGKIAFTSTRAPQVDPEIYSSDANGANPVRLTFNDPGDDSRPAYSPDGSKIVFRSDRAPHAGDNE